MEKEPAQKGITFEELQDSGPGRFHALDALLAQALIRSLPQGLASRVKGRELQLYHAGKTITGRQVAWLIYDWLKTEAHMSLVFGFADLVALTWWGDGFMEDWLRQWDHIVENREEPLSDKTLSRHYGDPFGEVRRSQRGHGAFQARREIGGATTIRTNSSEEPSRGIVTLLTKKVVLEQRRTAMTRGGGASTQLGEASAMPAEGDKSKGKSKKGRGRDRSQGPPHKTQDSGGSNGGGPTAKPCWLHNNAHHNGGVPCSRGKD